MAKTIFQLTDGGALVAGDLVEVSRAGTPRLSRKLDLSAITCRPYFSARVSGAHNLAANTFTKIQFNTQLEDSDACYDPTTNYRFTPNLAGLYWVHGFAALDAALLANKLIGGEIYFNGARIHQELLMLPSTVTSANVHVGALVRFNGTTDYVEFFAFNNHASATPAVGTGAWESHFAAFRVSA